MARRKRRHVARDAASGRPARRARPCVLRGDARRLPGERLPRHPRGGIARLLLGAARRGRPCRPHGRRGARACGLRGAAREDRLRRAGGRPLRARLRHPGTAGEDARGDVLRPSRRRGGAPARSVRRRRRPAGHGRDAPRGRGRRQARSPAAHGVSGGAARHPAPDGAQCRAQLHLPSRPPGSEGHRAGRPLALASEPRHGLRLLRQARVGRREDGHRGRRAEGARLFGARRDPVWEGHGLRDAPCPESRGESRGRAAPAQPHRASGGGDVRARYARRRRHALPEAPTGVGRRLCGGGRGGHRQERWTLRRVLRGRARRGGGGCAPGGEGREGPCPKSRSEGLGRPPRRSSRAGLARQRGQDGGGPPRTAGADERRLLLAQAGAGTWRRESGGHQRRLAHARTARHSGDPRRDGASLSALPRAPGRASPLHAQHGRQADGRQAAGRARLHDARREPGRVRRAKPFAVAPEAPPLRARRPDGRSQPRVRR